MDSSHFHPMTVHFPIALLVIGFATDTFSFFFSKKEPCLSKIGFYLMILGTLGAVAAYFTGEFFTGNFTGKAGELKETHEFFAKLCMFIMSGASVIRVYHALSKKKKKVLEWIVYILFAAGTASVAVAGYLGGTLVFDHMVGL